MSLYRNFIIWFNRVTQAQRDQLAPLDNLVTKVIRDHMDHLVSLATEVLLVMMAMMDNQATMD